MVSIPPGSSLGRYRIIEQLGRGGMATVFRAHDPNLDRHVAVKVLPSFHTEDPTFVGRFSQEAQTVASLNHPNILQIYDFGDEKGYSFIVSELVSGGDLQDRLGSDPMSLLDVLKFMRPLAEALDYAHGQGIVHRDLKPANILLTDDDRPILADFGLARMMESATRFTQASQALGTPEYMAPEQAMGADADHRTDLYAYGVMIYQMLLGETPFRADTPAATLMAHVHQPLPLPTSLNPDIEPRLEATLLKALAKSPDDRYQSAREMIQALALATNELQDASTEGDAGATAVMDLAQMDLTQTQAMEQQTAVMGTAEAPAAEGEAVAATGDAVAVPAPSKPPMALIGGGIAAAVLVVAIGAMLVFSGGGDGGATPDDGASAGATTAPPTASTAGDGGSPAVSAPPASEPTAPATPPEPVTTVSIADLQKVTKESHDTVALLRELQPKSELSPDFQSKADLETITRGFYRRQSLKDRIFGAEQLYKALGLMEETQDLEDILMGIQLQQVTALADPVAEKVYVVSDASSISAYEKVGITAAFMGGLQQQHFDIAAMRDRAQKGNSDILRALDALISGDVSLMINAYMSTKLTSEEVSELRQPIAENKLLLAPKVIQKASTFGQTAGRQFVTEVWGKDEVGYDGVNAAYQRPPVSTEQVLHPEKYFADEQPHRAITPNIADQIGPGWEQIVNNVMGEFLLRTYLEEHLPKSTAADAAEGWGGDSYSLLSGPAAERLLVMQIRWDTFDDSAEFFRAYRDFWTAKIAVMPEEARANVRVDALGETGMRWETPGQTTFVGQQGPVILLVIGDTLDLVGQGLTALLEAMRQELVP